MSHQFSGRRHSEVITKLSGIDRFPFALGMGLPYDHLNGLCLTKQNRNIVLSALEGVHFHFPNSWDLLYFVRIGGPWYVIRLLPSSRGPSANIPEKPCYERPVFAFFFSFRRIHEVCWIRLPLELHCSSNFSMKRLHRQRTTLYILEGEYEHIITRLR